MKIKLNKEYTPAHLTENVKKAVSDFRSAFTANDLCEIYENEFGTISGHPQRNVIEASVEAFSSNDITEDVSFMIDLTVKIKYFEYHELHFYIDLQDGNYTVNPDPILHEDRLYKFQ